MPAGLSDSLSSLPPQGRSWSRQSVKHHVSPIANPELDARDVAAVESRQCDESRPVCRDCHRHGVPCFYDRPEASKQDQGREAEQRTLAKSTSPDPPITSETHDEHTELRLLHNFTVGTSSTMLGAHLQSIKDCWSVEVPRLAFGYKPLLHAIFSISALHTAKSNPGDPGLVGIHRYHHEQALRGHRLSVEGVDTQTADAVCFTSILLLVDLFATLQDRPVDPYEPPLEWMHLVLGSVSVFDAALNAIKDTRSAKIWSIIETFPSPIPASSPTPNLESFSFPLDENEMDEAVEAYTETISYINATWLAMQANEYPEITCRRLMVFPLYVPLKFINLLQEK
ncbi:hypothetical protein BJX99DRAFT_255731 [Aspergillus californicus]